MFIARIPSLLMKKFLHTEICFFFDAYLKPSSGNISTFSAQRTKAVPSRKKTAFLRLKSI